MRVSSNAAPSAAGVQASIVTPLGTYAKPRRSGAFAARRPAAAASAGVIASILP